MFHDVVNEQVIEFGFTTIGARQYRITEENFEKFVTLALKVCSNAIFTFDGGGSFSEVIAPILEKYNSKGVFFISTNYINTDGFLNEHPITASPKMTKSVIGINEIYDIINVFRGTISWDKYKKDKAEAEAFHFYDSIDLQPYRNIHRRMIWEIPFRALLKTYRPLIVKILNKLGC